MSEQRTDFQKPDMYKSKNTAVKSIPRFLVLVLAVTCILTIFFCPIKKPQVVFNMTQGTVLGLIPSVMVVPSFGLPNQTFLYSFVIDPWTEAQYFEYYNHRLMPDDPEKAQGWSFAWLYWLIVDLLPSLLLVYGFLWFKAKRAPVGKNGAV